MQRGAAHVSVEGEAVLVGGGVQRQVGHRPGGGGERLGAAGVTGRVADCVLGPHAQQLRKRRLQEQEQSYPVRKSRDEQMGRHQESDQSTLLLPTTPTCEEVRLEQLQTRDSTEKVWSGGSSCAQLAAARKASYTCRRYVSRRHVRRYVSRRWWASGGACREEAHTADPTLPARDDDRPTDRPTDRRTDATMVPAAHLLPSRAPPVEHGLPQQQQHADGGAQPEVGSVAHRNVTSEAHARLACTAHNTHAGGGTRSTAGRGRLKPP